MKKLVVICMVFMTGALFAQEPLLRNQVKEERVAEQVKMPIRQSSQPQRVEGRVLKRDGDCEFVIAVERNGREELFVPLNLPKGCQTDGLEISFDLYEFKVLEQKDCGGMRSVKIDRVMIVPKMR